MIILWIANLSNGKTVTEKEMDWDDLPLEEVSCLQLVDEKTGRTAFIRKREGYQFFQYKKRALLVNILTGERHKTPVLWQRIGAVVNRNGDCIYIEMNPSSGFFDVRYDNVLDMRLNLPHLRISLPREVIRERLEKTEDPEMRGYLEWL